MQIILEHAVTFEEQQQGLMYRKSLPENHGMAFSYDFPQRLTFWSKNCLIDLDLAFLDQDHVIQEIYLLPQKPMTRITSMRPAQYVVEMNAGFFEKNGIEVGDQIFWDSYSAEIIQHGQALPQR